MEVLSYFTQNRTKMNRKSYFFNPLTVAAIVATLTGMAFLFSSYSSQPPTGKTGAPGESTCMDCHNMPSPDYAGHILIEGIPNPAYAGQTYNVTLRVVSTNVRPERAGFEVTALGSDNQQIGNLFVLDPAVTNYAQVNGREYIRHKTAPADFGNSDTVSWQMQWKAPDTSATAVFYAAAVLANGANGNQGDNVIQTSYQVAVVPPPPPSVVIDNVTSPTCHGMANGVLHASVQNPIFPVSYLWNTGDTIAWLYNISAGDYSVTVTFGDGSQDSASVTLTEPDSLTINLNASSSILPCGDSVLLTVDVTGGTPPYTFVLNTGDTTSIDSMYVYQPGYYCVAVYDANQCVANDCVGINNDPNGIYCNGITYDTIGCNTSGPVHLHAGAFSQNDSITYQWSGPNGFSSTDENPVYTEPGTYSLVATLSNGCSCASTVDVEVFDTLIIQLTEVYPATCIYTADGSIDGEVIKGEIGPFTVVPPIDGDNLPPGDYSVTVTNGVGCSTVVDFTIGSPDSVQVTVDTILPEVDSMANGAIEITTSGGTPPYNWIWLSPGGDTVATEDISGLSAGDYQLIVVDSAGCEFAFGPFTVSNIVATGEVRDAAAISLRPNPAGDKVMLRQDAPMHWDVAVYDMYNRLIYSFRLTDKQYRLDVRTWPVGIYRLVFRQGDRWVVRTLLVQH